MIAISVAVSPSSGMLGGGSLHCCYDLTSTMNIRLHIVYADGDAAATLLRPKRWSYAFVALLY